MPLQITLLRHAKPDKTLADYRLHPLSPEGRQQALDRRGRLGNPTFDLVLNSKLIRTQETARIVAGLNEATATTSLPELFYAEDDPRGPALDEAFKKLGHTALSEYFKVVRMEMESLAEEARLAIIKEVNRSNAKNVLVVGHGMLLQAIGIALAGGDPLSFFTKRALGECQGFKLTFCDNNEIEMAQRVE